MSSLIKLRPAERAYGFALAEAIIYLAIFSIIMTATLATTYQLLRTDEALAQRQLVSEEADFIIRKIDWLITGATNVNIRGPDILELTKRGQNYHLTFDPTRQSLTLNNEELNSQRVKIEQVQFTQPQPQQFIINLKINDRDFHLEYLTPT